MPRQPCDTSVLQCMRSRPKGNVLRVGHFCTNTPDAGRVPPWPLGHSRDCAEQLGRKTRQVVQGVHNQCSDILRESVFRPRFAPVSPGRQEHVPWCKVYHVMRKRQTFSNPSHVLSVSLLCVLLRTNSKLVSVTEALPTWLGTVVAMPEALVPALMVQMSSR